MLAIFSSHLQPLQYFAKYLWGKVHTVWFQEQVILLLDMDKHFFSP